MSIINIDYFIGQISIPFDNTDPDSFATNYIAVYEREILITILGYDLYKRFTNGLNADPIEQIWLDLRDGVEYSVDVNGVSQLIKWNGFKNLDKVSIIAYYVYFNWLRQNNEQVTGTGVGQANKENATDFDKNFKLGQAWNMASDLTGNCYNAQTAPTLYNFIINNLETYDPELFEPWDFTPLIKMNFLGI